ncbi:cytochrome c [Novosphingobium flavum]|uniref:Cytochrome c n=1 Tax=Novosphingobium flavum TaxID=1778672 RepID=A0A7X1FRE5_9SPHN|nr:cytochrome c [Novosphingobium flavum]MBC2665439.1 cytochrome c [Novosphingobium flavum]
MRAFLRVAAPLLVLSAPAFGQGGPSPALIGRGRILATAADCVACHTVEGQPAFAGGKAIATPFGTIHAPNITPDRETGIGAWSDAEFLRALHDGVGRAGEQLYPAFPYVQYTRLSDADVLAIKAYLFSLPPVRRTAPANDMLFPFGYRPLLRVWKWINFTPGRFAPEPGRGGEYNRGRYLAEALGHCNECHTPRTLTQGLDMSRNLAGGIVEGWQAFNITPDPVSGIGRWSREDIVTYLSSGRLPGRAVAGGPMGEVVGHSLRFLPREDLSAIAAYLEGQKPLRNPGDTAPRSGYGRPDPDRLSFSLGGNGLPTGRGLYVAACASCHGLDGRGTASVPGRPGFPGLVGNSALGAARADNAVLAIIHGVPARGGRGESFMPAFGAASRIGNALDDAQIALVANYVRAQFGNAAGSPVDATSVRRLRLENGGRSPLVVGVWAGMALIAGLAILFAARLVRRRARGNGAERMP